MSLAAEQITLEEYEESRKGHIEILHSSSKGWITLAEINNCEYSQRHYKYKELLENIKDNNAFISQNTFYQTYRRIEYIKELRTLYIDLDIYNTKYSKDAVIYSLEKDYFNRSIPTPNLIVDSGRGLYLIWNIKSVPSMALPLWNATEHYLYEQLKEFGADRKALDATRVLRIAGTMNTKTNTHVRILNKYEYLYDLKEIKSEYLPELPDKTEKSKGRPKKIVSLFNEHSLYYARIQDVVVLCELRAWDLKGHREEILFLYRYWNCCFTADPQEVLRMSLELNSQFVEPLQEREVVRATKSAEKAYLSKEKQYKYKNSTLIELLEITEEEQRHLKSIIGKAEANRREKEARKVKRRNENGLTKREQAKRERLESIKTLKAQGLSNIKIAEKLGVNKSTVGRLLKNI